VDNLLDFLVRVDQKEGLSIVSPASELLGISLLELVDEPAHLVYVKQEGVLLYLVVELGEVNINLLPVSLPDKVTMRVGLGPVDEL